jgi:hypothetical protein
MENEAVDWEERYSQLRSVVMEAISCGDDTYGNDICNVLQILEEGIERIEP